MLQCDIEIRGIITCHVLLLEVWLDIYDNTQVYVSISGKTTLNIFTVCQGFLCLKY